MVVRIYKNYGNKKFIALGDGAGSKKISQIGSKVIIGHLGDEMICMKKGNKIEILSKSEEREYSNRTYFVLPKNTAKSNFLKRRMKVKKYEKSHRE